MSDSESCKAYLDQADIANSPKINPPKPNNFHANLARLYERGLSKNYNRRADTSERISVKKVLNSSVNIPVSDFMLNLSIENLPSVNYRVNEIRTPQLQLLLAVHR